MTSVQEGRANEAVIAGQKRALELAVNGAPLAAVLDVLVRTVEEQSSAAVLGSILLVDERGERLLHGAAPSLPRPYCDAIHGISIGPKVGSCGTAAHTGRTVVVRDIQTDPLWAEFKGLAAEHGLRACWSTPVRASDGKVLATFALYHREIALPTDRDREIVELLGHTAAIVIERDLHAKKRAAAETALLAHAREQVARIGILFEHAPAGIAVLRGAEHVFETANAAYLRLVGGRDVIGKPIRDALPELAGQGIYELLDEVRGTGKPYVGRSLQVWLTRTPSRPPEDAYFDFVYQAIPSLSGSSEPDSILVVAFEVTNLVRAKAEAEAARVRAEASEHALRTFIDNLPELAWTARPDGFIDYYNRRWYEYTGETVESMRALGWERLHDQALLPEVSAKWRHSLETGEPFEMEFTLLGGDGARRWFLTRVVPSRDERGNVVRWFGTNVNIDAIKSSIALTQAMSEQSRETQAALLEMRLAKERAEARVAELEAERRRGGAPP